jgi:uncharacterized damage-inducible protein DinB
MRKHSSDRLATIDFQRKSFAMAIAQSMLAEFEHEAKTTRRFLERVPQDKLAWRAHEKSHTIGELAAHIANVPGTIVQFALADQSTVPDGAKLFPQPRTIQEFLDAHDRSVATVRATLPTLDDAKLSANWSAIVGGKVALTIPKAMLLRLIMMNHWIQHRGQLGVYLRLAGASVPASYGPSGDEM